MNLVLSHDDEGAGAAVVLIHGHPFDRSMWRDQVKVLRDRFRVITPDLRGYGASTGMPAVARFSDFAEDIARLLDGLEVEQAVMGGLSMGGQIVLEFYRRFPERVTALLLADTFAQLDSPEARARRHTNAARLEREGMAGYAAEILPGMVAPATLQSQPEVAAHVLRMMQRTDPGAAAAALRARAERPDYVPLLSEIGVPTLIVVGREDAFTPVADAELMHSGIAGSTLVVVDGAGHMPNMERVARFNEALLSFLDRL